MYVDVKELNQRLTALRANGSEGALEQASELERQAEKDSPDQLGIDPDAKPDVAASDGSTHVTGTEVPTPEAPPLPSEPQVAEAPPTAEERLGTPPPITEPGE